MTDKFQNLYVVGIGPGKAGTTWLFNELKRHPEVSTCQIKEPYFFTKNFYMGKQWYDSLFDDSKRVKFEVSNRYIFSSEALLENLKNFDGEVILVYFKRDPFSRAKSAYLFERQMGQTSCLKSFFTEEKLKEFSLQEQKRKTDLLAQCFPCYTLEFEKISSHEQTAFNEFCDFVGISRQMCSKESDRNVTVEPRSIFLSRVAKMIAVLLRGLKLYSALQAIKDSTAVKKILFTNRKAKLLKDDEAHLKELLSQFEK